MTVVSERTSEHRRPLPRVQAQMAREVFGRQVWYSADTGRWYRRAEGDGRTPVGGAEGRALRALRSTGLLEPAADSMPDGDRARRMALTTVGLDRLRASPTDVAP